MPLPGPATVPCIEVRRHCDDTEIIGPEIRVHAPESMAVTMADLEAAQWRAALQLWPQWRVADATTLKQRAEVEAMRTAAESGSLVPPSLAGHPVPAEVIARAMGAPNLMIVVYSPALDEACADATSRAIEHFATVVPVTLRWLVPQTSAQFEGVVRLGGLLVPEATQCRDADGPQGAGPAELPSKRLRRPGPIQVAYRPIIGRPHPASPAEIALHAAIEKRPDLAGRFDYNRIVSTCRDTRPIVDLVCADTGLIVEVDGYRFHTSRRAFAKDRQRDFELSVSGWRVLRLTHDEVMSDLASAIDKIRALLKAPQRPSRELKPE